MRAYVGEVLNRRNLIISEEMTTTEFNLDEIEELVNNVMCEMFRITSEEQDVIEQYPEEFQVY